MGDHDNESAEGAMWREFGLRKALANMPRHSPGRAVVEALLARGSLTPEEARRFKTDGLRTALANMPADSPGRAVVERLLAARSSSQRASQDKSEDLPSQSTAATARTDFAEQLERLVGLHEQGHLTDDEFVSAKRKLLS